MYYLRRRVNTHDLSWKHMFTRIFEIVSASPGSRIHCKSMHGYPKKSMHMEMYIHRSMDNWRLISIKHGYPFMDINCLRISIAGCPRKDIRAWISMWVSTLVWIICSWPLRYPGAFVNDAYVIRPPFAGCTRALIASPYGCALFTARALAVKSGTRWHTVPSFRTSGDKSFAIHFHEL